VMCSIEYTVAGNIATAESGQTCTEMVSVSTTTTPLTIDVTASTLTLSGGEVSMALNGTGSAAGGLVTCSPTGTGTASGSAGGALGHGG
jgi:hypothetical protein